MTVKFRLKFLFIALAFLAGGFFLLSDKSSASSLYQASDLIYDSKPASSTNHLLSFTVAQAVPPGGRITVTFQNNGVYIPPALNYTDIDLSVAASGTNVFVDRNLATTTGVSDDGVSVASGLGGGVTIDLNSTSGLNAGNKVRLEIGTSSSYGSLGDVKIRNASTSGAYWVDINTYDASHQLLDRVRTFIAMVNPVVLTTKVPKMRGNGRPTGILDGATTVTIMSLTTNYNAACRFSASSSVDFFSMTNNFVTWDGIYHTFLLTGLRSTMCYSYYVRCFDPLDSTTDSDDYLIHFCIAAQGEGGTGGGTGGGAGGGGGGGGGGGSTGGQGDNSGGGSGRFKPYPIDNTQKPSVTLKGWAYPAARLYLMQDSKKIAEGFASVDSSFEASIFDLKKGLYTFGILAQDTDGIKSIVYPSTFWVEDNTQTNVADILLPPTISLAVSSVALGADIKVSGQSIQNEKVEVRLYSPGGKELIKQQEVPVDKNGRWSSLFSTVGLAKSVYDLKARTYRAGVGWSVFGETVRCGVGEKVEESPCSRSDINKDKKVNLVDFSILMYYWGTTDANSDINQDGKINLVDFSIMMYCWTG